MVTPRKEDDIDIRITYFPFGGRGAALRLAAFVGNLTFEDKFISFDEFQSIRANKLIQWCTLPQITVYDEKHNEVSIIGQSNACLRYIGSKCNLYPHNPLDAVRCDEIMDFVEDIMLLLAPSEFCGDNNKKVKMRRELSLHELPVWLQKLEWRLQENIHKRSHHGYIVGNTLSIADCKLWCFIRHFGKCEWKEGYYKYIDEDILDEFPLLTEYKSFIANLPLIQQFDILWRKRHKGFKIRNPIYPQCFVWKRYRKQTECKGNGTDNDIYWHVPKSKDSNESIAFIVLGAVLLLAIFMWNENCVDVFAMIVFLCTWVEDITKRKKVQ